mgnify:CR=1 FL=1
MRETEILLAAWLWGLKKVIEKLEKHIWSNGLYLVSLQKAQEVIRTQNLGVIIKYFATGFVKDPVDIKLRNINLSTSVLRLLPTTNFEVQFINNSQWQLQFIIKRKQINAFNKVLIFLLMPMICKQRISHKTPKLLFFLLVCPRRVCS